MSAPPLATLRSSERTAVFLQKSCLHHRYIRSRDTSNIVERPERLRAVNVGLAAAVARLEDAVTNSDDLKSKQEHVEPLAATEKHGSDSDDLANALAQLNLAASTSSSLIDAQSRAPIDFVQSSAAVDLLNHPAVKFVHGDIERDVYLENLKNWAKDSQENIAKGGSEIPEHLPQGDLYLCPASIDAIQGALGTVCEAVDAVVSYTRPSLTSASQIVKAPRAFVAVRPPGHHCGEDTPSGFCFVNNVGVAAAHGEASSIVFIHWRRANITSAHLQHGINRVVVLDIDLHHGNGTQSIVWQINEETYRKTLEESHGAPPSKPGLQMYYGSIHDILSYPCEDGKTELVQAASVSIHGPHGQYIENIHLRTYNSEKEFWEQLYTGPYAKLIEKAGGFLEKTGGAGDDVLVFISCGFDASEHEYPSMSRHQRHVPTSFYHRFARETRKFAEQFARGRLISVLEGGYSDRALTSGTMAHLTGLACSTDMKIDESWWSLDNLMELERATKKRRGGRISQTAASAAWVERTLQMFTSIDSSHLAKPVSARAPIPAPSRVLRERRNPPVSSVDPSPGSSPGGVGRTREQKTSSIKSKDFLKEEPSTQPSIPANLADSDAVSLLSELSESEPDIDAVSLLSEVSEGKPHDPQPKKLPRVILRLGPRPDESS
ncbi:hypothetical protein AcW1_007629 [Taiwanofungus camphoratus]|nr:hypothetical protein AcV5_007653 [Antrodia cinnamomea]KAI0953399.1 hypothetical protein AcW1_007629 [Antrodia cinnamomea]